MLVDKDTTPEQTIFYIACCILEVLKHKSYNDIDELRSDMTDRFQFEPNYSNFISSLNFLYLIDRIVIKNKKIQCI